MGRISRLPFPKSFLVRRHLSPHKRLKISLPIPGVEEIGPTPLSVIRISKDSFWLLLNSILISSANPCRTEFAIDSEMASSMKSRIINWSIFSSL